MRILVVTDAWAPQVNGVVRTFTRIREELHERSHLVEVISPEGFRSLPCPGYPEIPLVVRPGRQLVRRIEAFAPEAIHIATEGPLGFAARRYCVQRGLPFTSSYATRFPEYVSARLPVPLSWGYAIMRHFHRPSRAVMVSTNSIRQELNARGFANIAEWTRGVDTEFFHPEAAQARPSPFEGLPRPICLYVGRVAVEKNIEAFLELELQEGTKVVVGDGPQLSGLRARYPQVRFAGAQQDEDLARHYAAADVFVFPSRTDTFGLVMLEALASGLPVAAFPVPGPLDVIEGSGTGVLSEDLGYALRHALAIPPTRCRAHALKYSWTTCAELFLRNLAPLEPTAAAAQSPDLGFSGAA